MNINRYYWLVSILLIAAFQMALPPAIETERITLRGGKEECSTPF